MPQNNETFRRPLRLLALGLALLLAALAAAACGNDNEGDRVIGGIHPADIVARYDGGEVTGKQLISFLGAHKFFNLSEMYGFYEMLPSFKQDMLYQLIAIRLITEDASDEIVKASRQSAAELMDGLKSALDEDAEYRESLESFLETEGITLQDLEDYTVLRYNLQSVLEQKYSDEELRAKYDEMLAADETAFLRATVRHILVGLTDEEGNERTEEEALKRAREAQAKLKNGADWTAVAKEYSEDPGSKDNGGKYEDVPVSSWVENFKQRAVEQPIGEVGEPFLTSYGYHVLVVEERRQSDFAEVRDLVMGEMISEYFVNMIEVEVPSLVTEVNLPEPELPEGFGGAGGGEADGTEGAEDNG